MISSTNLSLVPGTEIIEHNGERGIFVPMTVLTPSIFFGKQTYSLFCYVDRFHPRKKNPNSSTVATGRLRYPDWSTEKRLESPVYLDRAPVIQYIANPKTSICGVEGVLDDSFFTDFLKR